MNNLTFTNGAYRLEKANGEIFEGVVSNLIAHFKTDTITITDRVTLVKLPIITAQSNNLQIGGQTKTFEQIKTIIETELAKGGGASSADAVSYDNSTSGLQSTNVQGAIDELLANLGEFQKVTYTELVALRDGKKLVGGKKYRITDYECTSSDEETQCAGHNYDIIVTALGDETLSEECSATQHEGDTYFNGQNLNSWKLWYCLDNDASRFLWAKQGGKQVKVEFYGMEINCIVLSENDTTYEGLPIKVIGRVGEMAFIAYTQYGIANSVFDLGGFTEEFETNTTYIGEVVGGKGVVYRLIDDKGNDVSYDFKNIMFKRYMITDSNMELIIGSYYGVKFDFLNYSIDEDDYEYYYTFSDYNENDDLIDDSLIHSRGNKLNGDNVFNNVFFNYSINNILGSGSKLNTFESECENNNCEEGFIANFFRGFCKDNIFKSGSQCNLIGSGCNGNIFNRQWVSNIIDDGCNDNYFGSMCNSLTLGDHCDCNTFGDGCESIVLRYSWSHCKFENKISDLNEQRTYDNTSRRYYYDSNYNIKDEIISYIPQ